MRMTWQMRLNETVSTIGGVSSFTLVITTSSHVICLLTMRLSGCCFLELLTLFLGQCLPGIVSISIKRSGVYRRDVHVYGITVHVIWSSESRPQGPTWHSPNSLITLKKTTLPTAPSIIILQLQRTSGPGFESAANAGRGRPGEGRWGGQEEELIAASLDYLSDRGTSSPSFMLVICSCGSVSKHYN